jgi:hypothetical protein
LCDRLEAGVYDVTLEVEDDDAEGALSRGLLIQPRAKDGDNYDEESVMHFDNPISGQFDEEAGYGPKKLELIEGTFLGIANFDLRSDFTITFKKLS